MAVMVMAVASALAAPTVTVTSVAPHYPWNGLVDVAYTIADRTGYDCDYRMRFSFGSFVASNFTDLAWCDLPVANGSHVVTWDSAADGVNAVFTNVTVRAELLEDVVTEADADYLIVDVSSGSSSSEYPVRYAKADAGYTSAQFNKDAYKLGKIVFRRVKPVDTYVLTNKTSDGETYAPYTFRMGGGNTATGTSWCPVQLTNDYFLGIFEVTQKQYWNVTGANPSLNNSYFSAYLRMDNPDKRPVEQTYYNLLTVADTSFFKALSSRAKCRGAAVSAFVLPTEAQWEYACRAGTETTYYWGDASTCWRDYAWGYDSWYHLSAHEAGLLKPNAWGFYDMAGNVMELCNDWGGNLSTSKDSVIVEPTGPATGSKKVLRNASGCAGGMTSGSRTPSIAYIDKLETGYEGRYKQSSGFRASATVPHNP